jgi:diaminobutyrate-2-oxoglutarate transaminase
VCSFSLTKVSNSIRPEHGRTGHFFSFEAAGIVPDIVCLSKSLGAMGFPMSIVLLKPEMDIWEPGQHNGTFRGNNLAFIAATAAIKHYWADSTFEENNFLLSDKIENQLQLLQEIQSSKSSVYRGRCLIWGLEWHDKAHAARVSKRCFEQGLIVETCGAFDQVLKFLPPLTISSHALELGFEIIANTITALE